MLQRPARPGYGLFSLLVVVAVLAILSGLLIPAVWKVRLAANRMKSQNNMKMIGLALHSYHDAMGQFPAGVDEKQLSALASLLPYVEQAAVYKSIDRDKDADDKANARARATRVPTYESPLDEGTPRDPKAGPTSYFLVAGSKNALKDNDGIFYRDSKTRITGITDGTSNTLFAVESLRGDGGRRAVSVARQHVRLKEAALQGIDDETGVKDFKANKNVAGDRGVAWIDGSYLRSTISLTREFNDARPDVDCGGAGGHGGPRSEIGGTNAGFADGSVRFLTSGLTLATWQALATRAGGEVVNLDQ